MIHIATILKHNVIGKLLNHIIVFLINVFLARLLGASFSGIYFNELYVLNFVVFIFSAGLDYASIALLAQEPGLIGSIHKMLFKVVVLFAACLLLYVFAIMPLSGTYFQQPTLAIVLFSIGNLLLIFYQGVLSAKKKFNTQNLILCITNLFFLLYLVWIYNSQSSLISTEISMWNRIEYLYALLFMIQGAVMWALSYSKSREIIISVSWSVFIRAGVYIMISSLIYFVFLRIDNFFVQKYTDAVTLSNYVQCGKIGQYFLYFSSVISSTLLPFIASEKVGASFSEWKQMMKPYVMLLCCGALLIALCGKAVLPLLLGKDFTGVYPLLLVLLPGFVCLGVLTLMNAVYIGKGNIKKILIGDTMGLLIVIGFDVWLVPGYGAFAAAITSSAAYCFVFLFLLKDFKKQFTLPAKTSAIIQ